jgi:hypothetical protein
MARLAARITFPKISISSSALTADVVRAQVATAGGLLEWLHAKARQAREAWTGWAILSLLVALLGWIVREVKKKGVENFDPEDARPLADAFRKLSGSIRRLSAAGDASGMSARIPCRRLFRSLRNQGQECTSLAEQFAGVDDKWQATVSDAARERLTALRAAALDISDESMPSFEELKEYSGPSDEAIIAHLHRVAIPPSHPRD